MKKNRMMRLASVLLVLTLLSTSVVSGTFAKYITTDAQYDTARVAKFGVVASLDGDLFGATYVDVAGSNSITTYSVNGGTVSSSVSGEDFVVAPGTENVNGLNISINGTPEVKTKVIFDSAEDASGVDYADSDICLKAGTYGIMIPYTGAVTKENIGNYYVKSGSQYSPATASQYKGDGSEVLFELRNEVTAASDYHPLKWFVDGDENQKYTLEEVKDAVTEKFNGLTFEPNKANDTKMTIGWMWNYNDAWTEANENITDEDKMDTILGDMMASQKGATGYDVVLRNDNNYIAITYSSRKADTDSSNTVITAMVQNTEVACLTVAFNARLTVEQVD